MLNKGNSNDLHNVVFQMRQDGDWNDVHLDNLMEDKTIVVFGLPGAFTPTCSTYQLPDFNKLYDEFKSLGIDEIYCISVNDSFVMNAWAKYQNIDKIKVIPDGNGEFTRKMGMLVDKNNLGFGQRSWRYAAIVDDCNILETFIEPGFEDNCQDDPYGESSPQNILEFLKVKGSVAV